MNRRAGERRLQLEIETNLCWYRLVRCLYIYGPAVPIDSIVVQLFPACLLAEFKIHVSVDKEIRSGLRRRPVNRQANSSFSFNSFPFFFMG